ncbi:TonB-dependent receptor [Endozoicomonas sp. YOMI1]|uniref:TonB-dependent receptor n=1 Tax=Endozoicomonas sp. YOMI1 TaxID=2828739 RepID=UPI00214859B8|nr:TonB-dependent receptor [Endozoicomonas sp. YOMI1]
MKSKKVPLIMMAISLVTAAQATAASEPAVTTLDQVVVTASRSESSVSNVSGTVQVIGQQEIIQQSQPGQKLADVLEQVIPGFGPSTQTVTDRTQSLRGRRALILIDGIAQTENRQISRQLNSIRPENIERIEIISGASAIYGGGATGGIINVITRKPETDELQFASEAGFKVSGDELTTWTLNQNISGHSGAFDYLLSGTYESRGGIFDADGNRVNPDPSQVSRMDTDSKDALVKLGYDLTDQQRLEATLQFFDDQMDSDYAPDTSSSIADSPAALKGLELENQPYSQRQSIDLVYKDDDFLGNNLQAQTYYREREARFFPYPNVIRNVGTFLNQSTSTAEVFGLKLNLDRSLNNQLRLSYGLDYDVDDGEQRGQLHDLAEYNASGGRVIKPDGPEYEYGPDVETKTLGLYLQTSYDLTTQLTLNGGIRHERARVDISDHMPLAETWFMQQEALRTPLEGAVRKYDDTLFNLGLVFRLNQSNELFANYSQGFDVPDVSRILRDTVSPVSRLPNSLPLPRTNISEANLDAIKTDSFELGWRGSFENIFANVSTFYNESDKTITFVNNNVDLLDQKRKVYGIEGAIEYFLNDYWYVGGTYAFTEGRSYYKEIGEWLDLQAADVSPEKFTTFVAYDQGDLNVRLQSMTFLDYDKGKSYSSSTQKVTDRDINGYTTVDLLVSYDLPVGTVKAGITNLLNKDYETVYSQWARTTYSGISAHKAEGRAYNLSYRVEY